MVMLEELASKFQLKTKVMNLNLGFYHVTPASFGACRSDLCLYTIIKLGWGTC